jgi:hypothetical protein
LAKLPEGVETAHNTRLASPASPSPAREPFWTATPSAPSEPESAASSTNGPALQSTGSTGRAILQGIPLDSDVTLLLAPVRSLDDDDIQAIRAAAAPLVKLLDTRRLLGPSPHKENL